MTDMHVLVTGGAGCVGGAVTACPLDSGMPVVVLDDMSTGHPQRLAGRLPQSGSS